MKAKKKIKLSQNLQLGVSGPSSQSTFFKVGGVFFLVLSLILIVNIFSQLKKSPSSTSIAENPGAQAVLGAFDSKKATEFTYTVQKGDTLFNIAQTNNTSWQVVATLNNLKAPYNLKPGSTLKLPVAQ